MAFSARRLGAFIYLISLLRTSYASGVMDKTFEERLQLYSDWTSHMENRGRTMLNAWSPEGAPTMPPAPSPGPGTCNVLRAHGYQSQYADLELKADTTWKAVPNFGECCKKCNEDDKCQAWTRVAGGGNFDKFQDCYLHYSLIPSLDLDWKSVFGDSLQALPSAFPSLYYLDASAPTILESGTKTGQAPPEYYGCPYNTNAGDPCVAPGQCNINAAGQNVGGPCIG